MLEMEPGSHSCRRKSEAFEMESTGVISSSSDYKRRKQESNQFKDFHVLTKWDEQEFPMYMAMAELCITPTGFHSLTKRDDICNKIYLMCGDVSNSFTSRTTHLLAAHANTTKVQLARERNTPVMTMEWFDNLWDACRQNNPYIHASQPQFQNFAFPLFYNLSFVLSTQIDEDKRSYYEKLILEYGGKISPKLVNLPSTFFYICEAPETGKEYAFAMKKKIPCLSFPWIIESIHMENLALADDYEVHARTSPPPNQTFDCQTLGNGRHHRTVIANSMSSTMEAGETTLNADQVETAILIDLTATDGDSENGQDQDAIADSMSSTLKAGETTFIAEQVETAILIDLTDGESQNGQDARSVEVGLKNVSSAQGDDDPMNLMRFSVPA